jgi:hypothetical protein
MLAAPSLAASQMVGNDAAKAYYMRQFNIYILEIWIV